MVPCLMAATVAGGQGTIYLPLFYILLCPFFNLLSPLDSLSKTTSLGEGSPVPLDVQIFRATYHLKTMPQLLLFSGHWIEKNLVLSAIFSDT